MNLFNILRYGIVFLLFISQSHSHRRLASQTCSGHDACKNKVWNGNYDITCGGTNSERTCRSTTLNCGSGSCTIKTIGSGHDAYQQSTVNAKESQSFKLTCSASGQRDCQSNTIWCPQAPGTTCECIGCPSSVTMKCVQGVSCTNTGSASVDYVTSSITPQGYQIPDAVWDKDTTNTGKRPDCPFTIIPGATANVNYVWGTLAQCKTKCIEEPTGKCNMVSRYGETTKTATENWHCRFYACPDPNNFTWVTQDQWGNYASQCNTYKLPIRHYIESSTTCTKTINKTNWINKTVTTNQIVYEYRNISDYFYDAVMLESICNEGRYSYYTGNTNEAWTTKSWKLGCSQYKLGYKTLNQCKSKCNCNNSPSSFSSHSQYKTCSKTSASSNYLPCRQNACSGGNCCSRSSNICKDACRAFHNVKFSGKIVTYHDVYRDKYINKTRLINVTQNIVNYTQKTIYHDKWINKTRFIDKIRWTDKTRWTNATRWENKTRWTNSTRFIDKIQWTNLTRWINATRWLDKTRWTNATRWKNKTRWTNATRWVNKTRWIDVTRWINATRLNNVTRIIVKTKWNNVTNYKFINVTREILIKKYLYGDNCSCQNTTIYINKTIENKPYPTGTIENNNNNFRSVESINQHSNNNTDCGDNTTNRIFQIGFFITLAMTLLCFLMIAWRCGLRDMLEEFIDDTCFCGCRDNFQMCKTICCILRECCGDEENEKESIHNRKPHPQNAPRIEMNIMERVEVDPVTGENKIIRRLQV